MFVKSVVPILTIINFYSNVARCLNILSARNHREIH